MVSTGLYNHMLHHSVSVMILNILSHVTLVTHFNSFFFLFFILLKGEEPPVHISCHELLTVEHIFTGIQPNSGSFRLLFHECSQNNGVQFLRSTNLFSKM